MARMIDNSEYEGFLLLRPSVASMMDKSEYPSDKRVFCY